MLIPSTPDTAWAHQAIRRRAFPGGRDIHHKACLGGQGTRRRDCLGVRAMLVAGQSTRRGIPAQGCRLLLVIQAMRYRHLQVTWAYGHQSTTLASLLIPNGATRRTSAGFSSTARPVER